MGVWAGPPPIKRGAPLSPSRKRQPLILAAPPSSSQARLEAPEGPWQHLHQNDLSRTRSPLCPESLWRSVLGPAPSSLALAQPSGELPCLPEASPLQLTLCTLQSWMCLDQGQPFLKLRGNQTLLPEDDTPSEARNSAITCLPAPETHPSLPPCHSVRGRTLGWRGGSDAASVPGASGQGSAPENKPGQLYSSPQSKAPTQRSFIHFFAHF